MLLAFIIIAALVSTIALVSKGVHEAVLGVYLPVLLLWPAGYGWRFHGVPIDMAMAASAPILLVLLWQSIRQGGAFSLSDLLVLLYAVSASASSWKAEGASAGESALVATLWGLLPAYLIGRTLLEDAEMRVRFVRRIAFLFFVVSILSVYEYRMASNPFRTATIRLGLAQPPWMMQVRWGFGRVAGPYGHAILAGALFSSGLLFSLWLGSRGHWSVKFKHLRWLPGRKSLYISGGLLAGLWMTQSRGPWMGAVFGFLLLFAGRAKNVKRALRRTALLALIIFAIFAVYTNRYTDVTHGPQTQEQENAVYRRELIPNYLPVIDRGGLLGWSRFFPRVDGQGSIDNEYLEIALTQGYLGLSLFALIIGRTGWLLLRSGLRARSREDVTFCFCLLGIFTSIALTVTTVYLGEQLFVFFFLVAGWAQSTLPLRATVEQTLPLYPTTAPARFAFRRVFN